MLFTMEVSPTELVLGSDGEVINKENYKHTFKEIINLGFREMFFE